MAPRAKRIACSSKLKDTAAVERQKTGEIIKVLSVKSQTLGQKKKSCTTHCSLVIKNKGGKERERRRKRRRGTRKWRRGREEGEERKNKKKKKGQKELRNEEGKEGEE